MTNTQIVMWAFNATDRPGLVIYICLPISFLAGCSGGIWSWLRERKEKKAAQTDVEKGEEDKAAESRSSISDRPTIVE